MVWQLIFFFMVLNNILLSEYTTVCPFTCEGHGCFQVLAVMNKTDIYIRCRFLCENKFSTALDRHQYMWLMGCTFSFVRSQKTVFQSGCTIFAFPPVMNERPRRFTSLLALGVVSVLDSGHSNRCLIVVLFPWRHMIQSIFSYAYLLSVYLLGWSLSCWRTEGKKSAHWTEKASWDWKVRQTALHKQWISLL